MNLQVRIMDGGDGDVQLPQQDQLSETMMMMNTTNEKKEDNLQPDTVTKQPQTCLEHHDDDDDDANPNDHNSNSNSASNRRQICGRCHRPTPRACICEALPDQPIVLKETHLIILQHPNECKFKNRSVPILELCLDETSYDLCIGRRLGDHQKQNKSGQKQQQNSHGKHDDNNDDSPSTFSSIQKWLQPPNLPILIYPDNDNDNNNDNINNKTHGENKNENPKTMSLTQVQHEISKLRTTMMNNDKTKTDNEDDNGSSMSVNTADNNNATGKIVILVLDATWNYAREMHMANQQQKRYPPHMLQASIQSQDLPEHFQPNRFDIRTTPKPKPKKKTKTKHKSKTNSDDHDNNYNDNDEQNNGTSTCTWMSTAECIAHVLDFLEPPLPSPQTDSDGDDPNSDTTNLNTSIYFIIMKPLDLMVQKWNSFIKEPKQRQNKKSADNEPSRKKQKAT